MKLSLSHKLCIVVSVALFAISPLLPSIARAAFTEQGATILGGANYSGRSASLADIDNDGDLDLLFQGTLGDVNATPPTPPAQQLFRNNLVETGTLGFTNVTSTMLPISTLSSTWSAAWGDYNGDGRIDLFVGQQNDRPSPKDRGDVLRNDGAAGFSVQSSSVGLNDAGFHQNVAWADINNDRRLDLIIGMEGPEKNEIYLQNTAGQFTAVGAAAGVQVANGKKTYGMAIGDSDGDGDLDIYISTCQAGGNIRNNFFRNNLVETGSLTFTDIADSNGTQRLSNTYGTEFVDLDNDGDLDLYVTGAQNDTTGVGNPTKIYRNDGGNVFTDVDTITGHPLLSNQGVDLNGTKAIDYDNDGDLDLYFHDNLASNGTQRLYRNDGSWQFADVTESLGLGGGGLATGAGGYDSVWGDLDRDGDQDLVHPNNAVYTNSSGQTPTPERVYISDASTNGNHWLYIDLVGPSYDTSGIGASVYATIDVGAEEVTLRREANTNAGTFNQSDVPVHFGLGADSVIEWLRVVWPDGKTQFLHNVTADQYMSISYSSAVEGDFNGDGNVDGSDYIVWRDNLGSPFTMADYNLWRGHFGKGGAGAGAGTNAAVPEPATAGLLLVAMLAGLSVRRRS